MITAKNLTKIYTINKKNKVKALDNVSFSIADKGMVFVCGKSGSGKSTLLNLIAGLDEITSGTIIVDGNDLSTLKPSLFNDYRSRLVGFVFQEFCLLDCFTIKENIKISLNLIGESDDNKIKEILEQVDLAGYEDRYPKELSGGEKQRVAIARALIKNPKYILADEPTGNLDSKTTTQILNLLKKFSKDKLVIIISHNLENAYEYGDRIIELKDGKVIKDITKQDNYSLIENNTIYMPINNRLNDDELLLVNEKIKTGNYQISQDDNKYETTIQPVCNDKKEIMKKTKFISLRSLFKLTKGFTNNVHLSLFFTSFMVSLLVVMMVITQVFTSFDGSDLIDSSIKKDSTEFVLKKGNYINEFSSSISKTHLVPIEDEEIESFYDKGYEGNVYKLYSSNVAINPSGSTNHTIAYSQQLDYSSMTNPYVQAGKGVLECDISYLEKVYGIQGELDILAGSIEDTGKCEYIITDYFADCLSLYRGYTYQDILDTPNITMSLSSYNVKAIINTNYKTRYKKLINKFLQYQASSSIPEKSKIINEIQQSEEFMEFYNELNNTLAICYFVDGDYVEAYMKDTSVSKGIWGSVPSFYYEDGTKTVDEAVTIGRELDLNLKDGEMIINKSMLSRLFDIDPNSYDINNFEPFYLTMEERYKYDPNCEDPVYRKQFKIVGIKDATSPHIHLSYNDYYDLYSLGVFPYAAYFDNPISVAKIYNPIEDELFYSQDRFLDGIYNIMNIIIIFNDLFKLITFILTIVCVVMLISFGRRSIKKRIFEIGVVRALGGKNRELYFVILLQIVYMCLIVSVITSGLLFLLDDYINFILIESIIRFVNNDMINGIVIFKLNPLLVCVNLISILVLTVLFSSSLMLTLRKIKPINIIRKNSN